MYHTFTTNRKLSSVGNLLLNGPANVIIGKASANTFGGGTLNLLMNLEDGSTKVIGSYAADQTAPIYIPGVGTRGVDLELTGATAPVLYVEISRA